VKKVYRKYQAWGFYSNTPSLYRLPVTYTTPYPT